MFVWCYFSRESVGEIMKWTDIDMCMCIETFPCKHYVRIDSGARATRSGLWILQELIASGEYANAPENVKSHFASYQSMLDRR